MINRSRQFIFLRVETLCFSSFICQKVRILTFMLNYSTDSTIIPLFPAVSRFCADVASPPEPLNFCVAIVVIVNLSSSQSVDVLNRSKKVPPHQKCRAVEKEVK